MSAQRQRGKSVVSEHTDKWVQARRHRITEKAAADQEPHSLSVASTRASWSQDGRSQASSRVVVEFSMLPEDVEESIQATEVEAGLASDEAPPDAATTAELAQQPAERPGTLSWALAQPAERPPVRPEGSAPGYFRHRLLLG